MPRMTFGRGIVASALLLAAVGIVGLLGPLGLWGIVGSVGPVAAEASPQDLVGPYSLVPEERIGFVIGQAAYTVDDFTYTMDAAPFIQEGRTYVPLRYLGYALGAEVGWYPEAGKVSVSRGATTVELFVGRKAMVINGAERAIDVAPLLRGGRTYLPARFVAEAFGYRATWDAAAQAVVLTRPYAFSRDWLDQGGILVCGRPPVEYLRAANATGAIWSVYFGGLNPGELQYLRDLHKHGYKVATNLPMAQGYAEIVGADLQARAGCKNVKGEPAFFDFGTATLRVAYMCSNNAEWREFLKNRIREHIDGLADDVHLDEIGGVASQLDTTGFCESCMAGFRAYLGARYTPAELARDFGISDLPSFHYVGYLAAKGLSSFHHDPNARLRDEFTRFHQLSQKAFVAELAQYARDYASSKRDAPGATGRAVLLSGNLYDLRPNFQVYLPYLDFAAFEMPMGRLPEGKHFVTYLLGAAITPAKPVYALPDIYDMAALAPEDAKLWRHWLAEAAACGGSVLLPYEAFTAGAGQYTLPAEQIAPYTGFIAAHPDLYRGTTRLAGAALLFDLRSALYDWSAWEDFKHAGQELQAAHVPYAVAYAGDPELLDQPLTLEAVEDYAVLVVPAGHRFDAAAQAVLDQYQRQGGRIIYHAAGQDLGAQVRATGADLGLQTDAPADLGIIACRRGDALAVHLINYAYDYGAHDFVAQGPVRVSLKIPEGVSLGGRTLTLLSPDDGQARGQGSGQAGGQAAAGTALQFTVKAGRVKFTVPGVQGYAVAVFE